MSMSSSKEWVSCYAEKYRHIWNILWFRSIQRMFVAWNKAQLQFLKISYDMEMEDAEREAKMSWIFSSHSRVTVSRIQSQKDLVI